MTADVHTMTGAYAANALDDRERNEFEHHLAMCEACQQEVAELQATAAMLAAAQEQAPPPGMRAAVLAQIDQTRQERPFAPVVDLAEQRARRTWVAATWPQRLVGVAAGVLALVVIGLGAIVGSLNNELDELQARSEQVQAMLALPDTTSVTLEGPGGSVARALVSLSTDQAMLFGTGMAQAPAGKDYELWLIHDDVFVSAGLLTVHDDGTVLEYITGEFDGVTALGVTIEPAGGSPQPTSDPVMLTTLEA